MIISREDVTPMMVKSLVRYTPETGELFWRERGDEWFGRVKDRKRWNNIYNGKRALHGIRKTGHRAGAIFGLYFAAHRVAWACYYGHWPTHFIDHINGDPADNRITNLRDVPHIENCRNQSQRSNNNSGRVGVCWDNQYRKWRAYITVNRVNIRLGSFASKREAIAARVAAERKHNFHLNHGRSAS